MTSSTSELDTGTSKSPASRTLDPTDAAGYPPELGLRSESNALLTPADVEAVAEATARRLAELVGGSPRTFGLVGARELADVLGVSLDYVYAHATELGAMRLGAGPKARIRFDVDQARQALEIRTRRRMGRMGGRS